MMIVIKKTVSFFSPKRDIRPLAFVLSIIISLIVYSHQQPLNPDALAYYLPGAAAFLAGGLHATMLVYQWPLFGILIACVSKATGLSVLYTSYVLSVLLTAILVVAFITLMKTITSNYRIILTSALVILIFHSLNRLRADVFRDFGYWAFQLISITLLLQFSKTEKWKYAIMWPLFAILATLFRVEGASIICFAPLALFCKNDISFFKRIILILKAYTLSFTGGILLLIWLVYSHHHLHQLGRFADIVHQFQHAFSLIYTNLQNKVSILRPGYSHNMARTLVLIRLTSSFVMDFITTISFIYCILAVIGYVVASRFNVKPFLKRMLLVWTIIAVIPLALFYAQGWDMSIRYYIFPALLIISLVPFGLVFLYDQWRNKCAFPGYSWIFYLIVLILAVETFSGIFYMFGPSKSYIVQAGKWAGKTIPIDKPLYANDNLLLLYSNRKPWIYGKGYVANLDISVLKNILHNYEYFMLQKDQGEVLPEALLLERNGAKIYKIFQNKRHDEVIVYYLNK